MSPPTTYAAGSTVECREVVDGALWLSFPVTVVSDDGDILAVQLDPGAPFDFSVHPFGPHPWAPAAAWGGRQVLQLRRTGEDYAVWKFFEDGVFLYWYVNFETPMVRGEGGFACDDQELDLIVHPDGRREWKDVECLAERVREDRLSVDQVMVALAAGERVWALLDADDRWWAPWDDWTPAAPHP